MMSPCARQAPAACWRTAPATAAAAVAAYCRRGRDARDDHRARPDLAGQDPAGARIRRRRRAGPRDPRPGRRRGRAPLGAPILREPQLAPVLPAGHQDAGATRSGRTSASAPPTTWSSSPAPAARPRLRHRLRRAARRRADRPAAPAAGGPARALGHDRRHVQRGRPGRRAGRGPRPSPRGPPSPPRYGCPRPSRRSIAAAARARHSRGADPRRGPRPGRRAACTPSPPAPSRPPRSTTSSPTAPSLPARRPSSCSPAQGSSPPTRWPA